MSHDAVNWVLNLPLSDYERFQSNHHTPFTILLRMADTVAPVPEELYSEPEWRWGPLPTELGAVYVAQSTIAKWADCNRTEVLRTIKAACMCGVLLVHHDTLLTRALMSNISSRKRPHYRHRPPYTYLLNHRITKKGARDWLPEAFEAAWTFQRSTKKDAAAAEKVIAHLERVIPDDVWPPGYSTRLALFPPKPDPEMTPLPGLDITPLPDLGETVARERVAAAKAENAPASAAATTTPPRVRKPKRIKANDPKVNDLVTWWLSETNPSQRRVSLIEKGCRDIAVILLEEGASTDEVREAMRRCLPDKELKRWKVEKELAALRKSPARSDARGQDTAIGAAIHGSQVSRPRLVWNTDAPAADRRDCDDGSTTSPTEGAERAWSHR